MFWIRQFIIDHGKARSNCDFNYLTFYNFSLIKVTYHTVENISAALINVPDSKKTLKKGVLVSSLMDLLKLTKLKYPAIMFYGGLS